MKIVLKERKNGLTHKKKRFLEVLKENVKQYNFNDFWNSCSSAVYLLNGVFYRGERMVVFNIIENPVHHYETVYDEIKVDYVDNQLPVEEIQQKYDISQKEWKHVLNKFREDNIPLRGRFFIKNKSAKYYSFSKPHGKYKVCKWINGKHNSFGYFDSEEEAQRMVEYLKSRGWKR